MWSPVSREMRWSFRTSRPMPGRSTFTSERPPAFAYSFTSRIVSSTSSCTRLRRQARPLRRMRPMLSSANSPSASFASAGSPYGMCQHRMSIVRWTWLIVPPRSAASIGPSTVWTVATR
jgi:hypothetical protein